MKFSIHSILALVTMLSVSMSLSSCQDEDFGYTKSEIYQSYIERKYAEEFHKAFPDVDPEQTWMCLPDTVDAESLANSSQNTTRSLEDVTVPTLVYNSNQTLDVSYSDVTSALNYMMEEQDNTGKCAQNFEYLAVEETTYDIYPTFWGRKFCAYNYIGVYYIDANNQKQELAPFWSDTDNKIKVHFADGYVSDMTNSTSPITDTPGEAWNESIALTHSCSTCGGDGKVGETTENCGRCGGNGYYWSNNKCYGCTSCGGTGYYETCSRCGGSGKDGPWSCRNCDGDGKIEYNYKKGSGKITTGGTDCTSCSGTGKAPVSYYSFPKYTLVVPAGMKWGIYLKTRKNQTDTTMITWYSNADYNGDAKVSAAATFTTTGSNGPVTYCAFEDAPYNPENLADTGKDKNGYGHYDTDYNDIVLTISPRPIETTYKAVKYRVMCEDLGGTFDWDFNDIVYDVVYEEGKNSDSKATVSYILQAVGGTLPVSMTIDGEATAELHEAISSQSPDKDNLYCPVNVGNCKNAKTAQAKTLKTIILDSKTYTGDVRTFVQKVSIEVSQQNGAVTSVRFPDAGQDAVPQCFMTSTGTEWTNEEQNICSKYSQFQTWVSRYSSNSNMKWWEVSF